jgi:hypothetical protein
MEQETKQRIDILKEPLARLYAKLGSGPERLESIKAQRRLATFGPNLIDENKERPILKFFGLFWGPIPWMIAVAVLNNTMGYHKHWFANRSSRSI